MNIRDIIGQGKVTLSYEVFPPKTTHDFASVEKATLEIAKLKPSFMSVTYGAGGGASEHTIAIAEKLMKQEGVTSLAHLTCISSGKVEIDNIIHILKEKKIYNILALRGDRTEQMPSMKEGSFRYAYELVEEIKKKGDFCVGGACYPEGHVEASSKEQDIIHLKQKVEAGCDFLTTQMIFDNNILYNYLYRIREKDITVPVIAGIMPVTNAKQIKRICTLSGTVLPPRFRAIVERFGENPQAMKQAGIAYATEQIIDLIANGVNAIHVYSMNKPEVAAEIKNNLSEIIDS